MEKIPKDEMLHFNPDTMMFMRKSYNLDKPGRMEEAVDILDAWLKKQNHLVKKDFPRDYLERVIILVKGSVERAKGQIEKLCTLRTLLPQFFEKYDANDLKIVRKYTQAAPMPRLTEDHQRIYFFKFEAEQFSPKIFAQIYYYNILICEYLKAHDYSDGIITIVDFRDVSSMFDFVTQINLFEMKQMATIALDGYGTRAKKFVFISASNAIDLMVKILRHILPEKLRQRIYVAKDLAELHEHVNKKLLPAEYGGKEKPLPELCDDFHAILTSKENKEYLKEMQKARSNESLRTAKMADEFLGIEGTFRTLSFD